MHVLLDAVVKNLVLLCAHGKYSIEGEAVLLWPRAERLGAHLNGREVVGEGGDDLSALTLLDSIYRTEAGKEGEREKGVELVVRTDKRP